MATVDSILLQMKYNRKTMRGLSPKLGVYKKIFEENVQLGVQLEKLKENKGK